MGKFGFAIDRGGTFTDVYVKRPDGSNRIMKLLSEDPQNYRDAPTEAIRRVLEVELGKPIPRNEPIDASQIEWIRMGTTVATNALLERKGQRSALAITKGFSDLLYIGNQSRPKLFDLSISIPDVLYEEVVEIDERVVLCRDDCRIDTQGRTTTSNLTGDKLSIWKDINEEQVERDLKAVLDKGITSLAVVLLHSYMYDEHEKRIEQIAKKVGFESVSLSSQITPMIKAVPRGFTATADAYLTPVIHRYISSFTSGFQHLEGTMVLFMQSDGGLSPVHSFNGSRAILSGPAGGVVGVALTAYEACGKKPVVGFDMGGTSTDVSRFDGDFDHVFETTTAGVTIQAPQLDINTVAAGGGSRLFFRDGMPDVGPESAGADPGPVCYRKGGHLAVTDANLVLGRLLPEYFPKIFGPKENEPLDSEAASQELQSITDEVNRFYADQSPKSKEEVALGFLDVANEKMCRPIRALTQAKGFDTSQHILACFGGAGAQHACAIAKSLGMKTVFIHKYAGILSAYGLALADVVYELQEPYHSPYDTEHMSDISNRLASLADRCRQQLHTQGFTDDRIVMEPYLYMRYDRTDCALMCKPATGSGEDKAGFEKSFLECYKREFGFTIPGRTIIVDDVRVRGIGQSGIRESKELERSNECPQTETTVQCYFKEGYQETSVYFLNKLLAGHSIPGPAIIVDATSTILVEPDCTASITIEGDVIIQIGADQVTKLTTKVDTIQLAIFSHRFMSIAEQMGRVLQRTAISTNIKERLDFSCALFGPDGGLVANAPHIPVHLGAMQEAVRFQMYHVGDEMKEGDVLLCNHPSAGGSHLPDLTVITPVYYNHAAKPAFFVANRGHHADIGGLVPGSMPPHSTNLDQEGAAFLSFKLVEDGLFREEDVTKALMDPGRVSGCSGTRNLSDNLSDLRAQVAANHKGIGLVCQLIDIYGEDVVQAYMGHIQENADLAVRDMLKEAGRKAEQETGQSCLHAVDFMDDGTPIELSVKIDLEKGDSVFDFTGTGPEVYGNCNTPTAVTKAAVVYCLRCLVGRDIPLNQGCMKPVRILLPPNSILNPSESAAVVGGNVQTSQRIVDVVLKAFDACAASQGCMNNITFGDQSIGYYETVAGGAGAGPHWNGRSGIHTHMTNTRITDPEILERRYPVILNQFTLRKGSGGRGRYMGGDGIVREYLFRKPLTLSILTERRVFAPYGLHGGEPGTKGLNLLCFKNGRTVNLGSKSSVPVDAGDIFILNTPGGGGWSREDEKNQKGGATTVPLKHTVIKAAGSLHSYKLAQESA